MQGVNHAGRRARKAACPLFALVLLAWLPAATVAAQPLRIGTSGDYAPFSTVDANGARQGFDIELATRLARDLGRQPTFVAFRWPELSEALVAGRFDVACSGVTIRPERQLAGRFTRPYVSSGATALVRKTDRPLYASAADLDRDSVRIVVNRGGHLEAVTRARFPRARIDAVDDNTSLPARVLRGDADALVTDTIEARPLLAAADALVALPPFTWDRKALLIRRNQLQLHAAVDRWLAEREADGWLNQLRRQWLGADAEISVPRARIEAVVALVDQRLRLMPLVAAAKRRRGRAVEDRAREQEVLAGARAMSVQAGLDADRVAALFAALIDAAKMVQRSAPAVEPTADLDQLRLLLGDIGERLVTEVASARVILADPQHRAELEEGVGRIDAPGLDAS